MDHLINSGSVLVSQMWLLRVVDFLYFSFLKVDLWALKRDLKVVFVQPVYVSPLGRLAL